MKLRRSHRRAATLAVVALIAGLLSACYHNSIPLSDRFGGARTVARATIFVDANGRFYPDDWENKVSRSTMLRWHAFDRLKSFPDLSPRLASEERRQLGELEALMRDAGRVFIVIHGFNDTEPEATFSYDRIVERTMADADPTKPDLVIRFYWDGETATIPGGQIPIWFKAVVHSQMAGILALRKILDRAHGKDIYLISHSRGASVVLSALSNPPFRAAFLRKIPLSLHGQLAPPPLAENNNRIRAIMLAPAIGAQDFLEPRCATIANCGDSYRQFSDQLLSIRYTINRDDWVLKKLLPGLSSRFYATDLGYKPDVGIRLRRFYPCLTGTPIKVGHGHKFGRYVIDPEFGTMFDAARRDTLPCSKAPPGP